MTHVSCDYCGADDAALLFRARDTNYGFAGVFDIVRCRRCDLVYLNPRPTEQEIGGYYPDGEYACFKDIAPAVALSHEHHFVRAAAAVGLMNGGLCDIGCGSGDFLAAAQAAGWQVAGIEPHGYARRLCQAHLPAASLHPSLTEAAFPPGVFDAVTMWHVLEHVPSPAATLTEVSRLLRPGGLLGIAVPNFGSVERRIWGRHWIAIQAPTHLFHFEQTTLTRYLARSGFEILSVMQVPGANSLAANVLRTLRNLMLDPIAAAKTAPKANSDTLSPAEGKPARCATGYPVSAATKSRALQATIRIVYPLAWLIARAGYGPELLVYARKQPEHVGVLLMVPNLDSVIM